MSRGFLELLKGYVDGQKGKAAAEKVFSMILRHYARSFVFTFSSEGHRGTEVNILWMPFLRGAEVVGD